MQPGEAGKGEGPGCEAALSCFEGLPAGLPRANDRQTDEPDSPASCRRDSNSDAAAISSPRPCAEGADMLAPLALRRSLWLGRAIAAEHKSPWAALTAEGQVEVPFAGAGVS